MIGKRDLPSSLFSFANDNYTLTRKYFTNLYNAVINNRRGIDSIYTGDIVAA